MALALARVPDAGAVLAGSAVWVQQAGIGHSTLPTITVGLNPPPLTWVAGLLGASLLVLPTPEPDCWIGQPQS